MLKNGGATVIKPGLDISFKKSVSGLRASALTHSVNLILTLFSSFIFAFYVAPENFGLMAMSGTFVGFIALLKDFGYTSYIIQNAKITEEELISINTRVLILGTAAFLGICAFVIPISKFYDQVELLWILPITGALFILNSFTLVPQALMRKDMQFGKVGTDSSTEISRCSTYASSIFEIWNGTLK